MSFITYTYSVRFSCAAALLLITGVLNAQTDPGPRSGPAAAGGAYPTLNSVEQGFFTEVLSVFKEIDSVSGAIAGEPGSGLGPTFNGNSCAMCHAQPAAGGSSPGLKSPQNPVPNPQVALATLDGAKNTVPSFITANGPVREARFISVATQNTAALDGGVHGLYTIAGRSDAPGCTLAQPDFATQVRNNNVIFRIPTSIFGLGLVESTPDSTLQANLAANQSQKAGLGITGHLNTSGNDGTVTRFGWKAQNKSLMVFAGEAYNVEQGVSNDAFPDERSAVSGCVFNSSPEDRTDLSSGEAADVVSFTMFMRLTAPAAPAPATTSTQNGSSLFTSVACALCHTPMLTSGLAPYTGMSNVTYHPYSDFALHNMGSNLADGVAQGNAGPDEFRTAPLWGLGQRLFFLHDGRTSDLMQAIQAHSSPNLSCTVTQSFMQFLALGNLFQPLGQSFACGSEANQVIQNFDNLKVSDKQDLLNFLRSL